MNEKTRRPNRAFTPEQKYEILKDIEKYPTIREVSPLGKTSQHLHYVNIRIPMFVFATAMKDQAPLLPLGLWQRRGYHWDSKICTGFPDRDRRFGQCLSCLSLLLYRLWQPV